MERVDRWLSVIGNAGVILGLILVAVELRQTTNAMQGATYFARAESSMQWNMWIAESDHMLPAIVRC